MPSTKKAPSNSGTAPTHTAAFSEYLEQVRVQVDAWLDESLPSGNQPPIQLHKAMRHAVFAGGKRLRPALVLLSCEAFGGSAESARAAACALEMIHSYSLAHDDLPCMDDADLRRGKPSCHKAFGEATAVLAGDGLLTEAFRVLAETPDPRMVPSLLRILGEAAGSRGMVGGQQEDLEAEGLDPNLCTVERIHLKKTAALIAVALEMGAVCAQVDAKTQAAVKSIGIDIGLAFQIIDDVLDETSDSATLGKRAGQDLDAKKMTYPACLGVKESRQMAKKLLDRAQKKIAALAVRNPQRFESLTHFMLERAS